MSEKRNVQRWMVRLSDSTERLVYADQIMTMHDGNELRMFLDGKCVAVFFHQLAAAVVPDVGAS